MYLRDLGASLLRRWYLVIVGIGATVGLSFLASNVVAPTYEAKSSLVLVPPSTTVGKTGNPYLFLGGLQQSVDVLARALNAESTHRQVALTAPTGEYKVEADFGTSAPIIQVTANDDTKAGTQRLLDAAVRQAPLTLGNLQKSLNVRTAAQITTMIVSADEQPNPVQKTRYRTIALVTVGSLFLILMAIGLLDGLLLRRRARKAQAVAEAVPDEVAGDEPSPASTGDDDVKVDEPTKVDEPSPTDEPVPVQGGETDPEPELPSPPRPARKLGGRKPQVVVASGNDDAETNGVARVDGGGPEPEHEHRPLRKRRGRKAKVVAPSGGGEDHADELSSTDEGVSDRDRT